MKRFSWLWCAVAGAIVLPMLTIGSALLYLSSLWKMGGSFVLSVFQWNVSDLEAVIPPACVGAILGGLSGALWRERSFTSRALCAAVGVAATAIGFGLLWRRLEIPVPPPPNILGFGYLDLKQRFLLLFVEIAPTLLWAWTLLFAAPFVRSSPQNPKRELALWLAASAVAGAVLLPLATGTGANIYLLQTGHSRVWIGTLVTLFWVQLPLTGAIFGALSVGLWQSHRSRGLRSACISISLGAMWLTLEWMKQHLLLFFQPSATPTLTAIIAFPTTLWALAILFFALVMRTHRALIQTLNTD